jgi:hypothetical protein
VRPNGGVRLQFNYKKSPQKHTTQSPTSPTQKHTTQSPTSDVPDVCRVIVVLLRQVYSGASDGECSTELVRPAQERELERREKARELEDARNRYINPKSQTLNPREARNIHTAIGR